MGSFVSICLGIGICLNNYLFVNKIRSVAVSSVASVAIGLVELSGRAISDTPEKGPVSGTPCAYWKITGEYYRSSGRSANWIRFYEVTSTKRFYLKDDTGRIHIDPEGGKMDIWEESHQGYIAEQGRLFHQPPTMDESVMNYIQSLDSEKAEQFAKHEKNIIRITEHNIGNNEPLYVVGSAELVGVGTGAGPGETLEIRKGDDDETCYITNKSERQVIQKFSSWIHVKIFGGLALCAVVLYVSLNLPDLEARGLDALVIALMIGIAVAYAVFIAKEYRHDVH
jgi:hypothetical protein